MISKRTTQATASAKATITKHSCRKRALVTSCKIAPKRKSVRFSRACNDVLPPVAGPKGQEAKSNAKWYERCEYALFKQTSKTDLKNFAFSVKTGTSQHLDMSKYCMRGLENYFPPSKKVWLDQKRRYRVYAVLHQQALQRVAGVKDPDSLALVAQFLSEESRDRAIGLARRDALECTIDP